MERRAPRLAWAGLRVVKEVEINSLQDIGWPDWGDRDVELEHQSRQLGPVNALGEA
jgi:hypothetical protein